MLAEAAQRGGGDDARLGTSLGVLALKLGNIEHADATLAATRAVWGRRLPPAAWFHYAALAAALNGDLDRAQALITEGMSTHPHSAPLHNTLAIILERRGDYQAAAQVARRGLLEDSTLPQLHKNLGDCHYHATRYDEAEASYLRAIKIDPALGDDVYLKLGNIRFRRNERAEAIACWERALELDPTNAIVRTNLDAVRQVL